MSIPIFSGRTNASLLAWALALRERLEQSNIDRKALCKWSEESAQSDEADGVLTMKKDTKINSVIKNGRGNTEEEQSNATGERKSTEESKK